MIKKLLLLLCASAAIYMPTAYAFEEVVGQESAPQHFEVYAPAPAKQEEFSEVAGQAYSEKHESLLTTLFLQQPVQKASQKLLSLNLDALAGSEKLTEQVAAYALNYVGVPYVYGGNTPEQGFDCSGYVKYVYAKVGIEIARVAADQANQGVEVSREELQIGDLVFFKMDGAIDHVGLYLGGGVFIHSPKPGESVRVDNLDDNYYVKRFAVAKRYI